MKYYLVHIEEDKQTGKPTAKIIFTGSETECREEWDKKTRERAEKAYEELLSHVKFSGCNIWGIAGLMKEKYGWIDIISEESYQSWYDMNIAKI